VARDDRDDADRRAPGATDRHYPMCGRFTLKTAPRQVAELFKLDAPPDFLTPRYNVSPAQIVAVVGLKPDGKTRGLVRVKWGFVPS
jgi:putative SOS response-associated peptidase YedK